MLRQCLRSGIAVALILLLAAVPLRAAQLTFLHFNDIHDFVPSRDSGGLAALTTLIEAERTAHPGALLTFGGDMLSPSVASALTKGAHMIDLVNRLAPVAATLGNHEFDFGAAILRTRMAESRFPWLVTNVAEPDGSPFARAPRLKTLESGGVKIGLFSILTSETAYLATGGHEAMFLPEIATAQDAVAELRRQGAEVVVALTHQELEQDLALARQVKGINLILGGHDHTAVAYQEGDILVAKAGSNAQYLAAIDLEVEPGAKAEQPPVVHLAGWRLLSTRGVTAEAAMAAQMERHLAIVGDALNQPLATLAAPLDSRQDQVRAGETALGDFVADTLREAFGADVALINGGGLRGDRLYPAGTVLTRADMVREMPFGNTAMVIEITGADLLAALENGVSRVPKLAGRFPQVSGLSFHYDPQAALGQRVGTVIIAGKALDPAGRYRLATVDYLIGGGDAYAMLANGKILVARKDAPLLVNLVMERAERLGTIAPAVEGRIRVQGRMP